MDFPTREELIALCERGLVPQDGWHDRDSAKAQMQLGQAWALLRAGCPYEPDVELNTKNEGMTLWVNITYEGFNYFEVGEHTTDIFYIPTASRLEQSEGGDWY